MRKISISVASKISGIAPSTIWKNLNNETIKSDFANDRWSIDSKSFLEWCFEQENKGLCLMYPAKTIEQTMIDFEILKIGDIRCN